MKETLVLNMSNSAEKAWLIQNILKLQGDWKFTIAKAANTTSNAQTRLYFVAIVRPLWEYLRAQGWPGTMGDAHELLKKKFLLKSVIIPETGEYIGDTVGSHKDLTTTEMAEYIDKCAIWEQEKFGIQVTLPQDINAVPGGKKENA